MSNQRTHLFNAPEDVKRTAEELRVQLHLAVADAEVHWVEAEKRLQKLKSRLDQTADESVLELSTAALEVIDDVKRRIESVKDNHSRHHTKH
jgi:hypothetical protein